MRENNYEDTRHLLPRFRTDEAAGVNTWLRAVFEGGGAKGIAYRGALDAVEQNGCWFEAVAGSSAGAITAALIAAGYSPREFDEPMKQSLELFTLPKFFKSMRTLRKTSEIFSGEDFRETLDALFRRKSDLFGVKLGTDRLTFKELHDATGVDLFVVAADISRREPIVFHHRYTPDCQVADAVVASASIPFAFDGGMLTAKASILPRDPKAGRKDEHRVFRTIVDGGVWVNFPMFIFKDSIFHDYMAQALGLDRDAAAHSPGPVVGFLLHELIDDEGGDMDERARRRATEAAYMGARFEREAPRGSCLAPIEQTDPDVEDGNRPAVSPKSRVQWRYGPDAARWPNPKRELYRLLLVWVDKSLAWGTMTWSVAMVLTGVAITELSLLALLAWYLPQAVREGWTTSGWDLIGSASFALICIAVYAAQFSFVVSVLVGPALANWVLHVPARRVLFGVSRTLVATPGSSPWEHLHADVIALPIPTHLTTLNVHEDTGHVIGMAKAKTNDRLPAIIKAFADRHNRSVASGTQLSGEDSIEQCMPNPSLQPTGSAGG